MRLIHNIPPMGNNVVYAYPFGTGWLFWYTDFMPRPMNPKSLPECRFNHRKTPMAAFQTLLGIAAKISCNSAKVCPACVKGISIFLYLHTYEAFVCPWLLAHQLLDIIRWNLIWRQGNGTATDNLFACGSTLAHQDSMWMKCSSGLATGTASAAVDIFLLLSLENSTI